MIFQILNYITFGLSCISLIFAIIITLLNKKYKKFSELMAELPKFCEQAEKMFEGKGKGEFKHDYVMTNLRNTALHLHYAISDEALSTAINDFVESTKHINISNDEALNKIMEDSPFRGPERTPELISETSDSNSQVTEPNSIRGI